MLDNYNYLYKSIPYFVATWIYVLYMVARHICQVHVVHVVQTYYRNLVLRVLICVPISNKPFKVGGVVIYMYLNVTFFKTGYLF